MEGGQPFYGGGVPESRYPDVDSRVIVCSVGLPVIIQPVQTEILTNFNISAGSC